MRTPKNAYVPAVGSDWRLPLCDVFTKLLGVEALHRKLLHLAMLGRRGFLLLGSGALIFNLAVQTFCYADEPSLQDNIPAATSRFPFDKAVEGLLSIRIPLTISLPPGYLVRKTGMGSLRGNLWGEPDDLNLVLKREGELDYFEIQRGVFNVTVSLNVSYDRVSQKFTGEDRMAEDLKNQGVANADVARVQVEGFPLLSITGEALGRHLYIAYVAVGESGETLKIVYRHPREWTDRDDQAWNTFLHGLQPER